MHQSHSWGLGDLANHAYAQRLILMALLKTRAGIVKEREQSTRDLATALRQAQSQVASWGRHGVKGGGVRTGRE